MLPMYCYGTIAIVQSLLKNNTELSKNLCPAVGGVCFNRGCGMYHENCLIKNKMEKPDYKKTVEDIRQTKQAYEEKIHNMLLELTQLTGMQPSYIEVRDAKVIITLSIM